MSLNSGYLYLSYSGDMGEGGGAWLFMQWLCLTSGYTIVRVSCKDEPVRLYHYFEIDYVSAVVLV